MFVYLYYFLSMSKLNFYLNRGRVFASYYFHDNDRMSLMLPANINIQDWDKKKQRVKSYNRNHDKINQMLDMIDRETINIRMLCVIDRVPFTSSYLKRKLQERLTGNISKSFNEYAANWINRKLSVKDITRTTYNISINIINQALPGLMFDDINRYVHTDLLKALKDKGYKQNYINRVFKVFRAIINDAYVDGIHDNKFHLSRGFVPGTEEVDNVYLTIDELNSLFNLWKSGHITDSIRNSINIFLRGCYTGQRWQTFSSIVSAMVYNVRGVDMIHLKQEKTGVSVSVPVSDKLKELLKDDVKMISRQKLVDYIKAACKICGIDKWEKVSSHTARRSFATNMVLAGVDITRVMSITGHKTEKEFRKYVKIDSVINAQKTITEINQVFA